MSHLLIKYSIFVLYGREILVVIRVPPQRKRCSISDPGREGGVKITAPTKMLISVNFIVHGRGPREDTRDAYCFDKRVDGSKFIADFAKVIFSSKR